MGVHPSRRASLPTLLQRSPICSILSAVCFIYFLLSSIPLDKLGPKLGIVSKLTSNTEDGSWPQVCCHPRTLNTFSQTTQILPSKTLVYHPCYNGLRCARLELPLDWQNTTESAQTVAIALLKIPARVPVTDARYGGSIFINPGR
jgi:hypothetical protein